jgi:hypothetical protein
VKIKVIHDLCGREVMVRQILESNGHCPWDGKAFNRDYTAVLAEALEQAEDSGSVLENALEKIAGMEPSFAIDPHTIVDPIKRNIDALNRGREPGKR